MTPTDKSKPFSKVYVFVDKTGKTVSSTRVMEKAGNRYSYTVNSLVPNGALDDKQFIFDQKKYPGVEVVDLR